MIGYHITNKGIATSEGDFIKEPPYLDFMVDRYPGELKIFYDMDASVSSLVRLTLNRNEAERLHKNEKVSIPPYRMTYFPSRFFSIDKGFGGGHPYANFANMRRYRSDVHYSPDETVDDWIAKAKEAEEVGEQVSEILKGLGVNKDRIISPVAAVVDEYVKSLRLPTVDDIPEEAGELAYGCIKGNHLEAWKLGYWEKAFDQDLNGAYGSELAKLPDLKRGDWVKDTEPPGDAVFGFCEGEINTMAPFHPFLMKAGEDFAYTPTGRWPDCFTLTDLKLMYDFDLGKVDIKRGQWWIPKGTQYTPLKGLVEHLWKKRMASEGLEKDIIRQVLAGIWGRFSQVTGGAFGEAFNPVYAAVVENNTRDRVARTCLDAGVYPLHIAVDGAITNRILPGVSDTRELGGWRLSHEGRCIIASAGVVAFEGKQGAEEFSLSFDRLYNAIKADPEASEYTMSKWSPVTMGRGMGDNFDKLGELEQITRSIYIGKDYKRMWKESPKCGGDLLARTYDSVPVDAHLIGVDVI